LRQPSRIAQLVVSMDRLLRYFLQQFIRRGAMTFTTASGAKFSCGDGTGEPVCVRFLTTEAERRFFSTPNLRWAKCIWRALSSSKMAQSPTRWRS